MSNNGNQVKKEPNGLFKAIGTQKLVAVIALIVLFMFFWIFGRSYVESQISKGREKPFTKYFYPVCKYLYIPVCFLVLILGVVLGGIG